MEFDSIDGQPLPEELADLLDEVTKRSEKFGLYLKDTLIGAVDRDIATAIAEGKTTVKQAVMEGASISILATFAIGDVAWSDRIQDPDGFKVDQEFKTIMPTEDELIKDELIRKLREGKDIFGD